MSAWDIYLHVSSIKRSLSHLVVETGLLTCCIKCCLGHVIVKADLLVCGIMSSFGYLIIKLRLLISIVQGELVKRSLRKIYCIIYILFRIKGAC